MAVIASATASVGSFMPTTLSALAGAEAGFTGPIADIEGQIAGTVAASATVAIQPPSLDLTAALAAAAKVPGAQVSVEGMGVLGADLGVTLGELKAALELILAVKGNFGATVKFIASEGAATQMGADITGILAGDAGAQGVAVVLVAESSASVAALKSLFGLA